MKAVFVELPAFARWRAAYLDGESFRRLEETLMAAPDAGDLLEGTGGLRKLRFGDAKRGKGKRGGLRIVYYWWQSGAQFWLVTLFDKSEAANLAPEQRAILKRHLKAELEARRKQ